MSDKLDTISRIEDGFSGSGHQKTGRIKLFGFRSGVSYKMVPALLYYGAMLLIYISSIVNEIRYYDFTFMDAVMSVSKYLFIGIFLFSPAIFLSDFNYIRALPFFRKKTFASGLCGLIIVFMFCYFMWNIDIMCLSSKYWDSVKSYERQLKEERNETGGQLPTESILISD